MKVLAVCDNTNSGGNIFPFPVGENTNQFTPTSNVCNLEVSVFSPTKLCLIFPKQRRLPLNNKNGRRKKIREVQTTEVVEHPFEPLRLHSTEPIYALQFSRRC